MDGSHREIPQSSPDAAPAQPASETPPHPEVTIVALKPQATPGAQPETTVAIMVEAAPAVEPAPVTELKLSSADRIAASAGAASEPSVQPPVAPAAIEEAHRVIDAMTKADAETAIAPPAALPAPSVMARIGASAWWIRERRRYAAYAGGAAAALAAGWVGAAVLTAPAQPAKPDPLAAQTAMRVEQLSADIRGVRDAVAALAKGGRPRSADDLKPLQERVGALGEAVDKMRADQSAKIAGLVGSADRGEKADRDISAKMAQIVERLDRIDRANGPQTTGSVSPQPQQTAAAQPIPAPPPRPATEKPAAPVAPKPLAGWTLRDIYDGLALIENRQAGLIEVAPGQIVRGLGRIEKIERRDGRWVVVTQQGVIAAN